MRRKYWLLAVPLVLLVGVGSRTVLIAEGANGADRRILSRDAEKLEAKLGYHLYAPTWLPGGGKAGRALIGARRVLQDYSDGKERTLLIVSQEPITPERDKYHQRIFRDCAEAKAEVKGRTAYFVTGKSGERRLFWNEADAAVIISSATLGDEDLLRIAAKMQ